jgi:hypothetical protein
MHHILLIALVIVCCLGPIAVIRAFLGFLTFLALAVGATVVMYWLCRTNEPATQSGTAVYQTVEPSTTPNDYAPRAILVSWGSRGAPDVSRTAETPAVTVRRAVLVELPKAPKVIPIRRAELVELPKVVPKLPF